MGKPIREIYLDDIHVSEREKQSPEYLKNMADYWISSLVHEKRSIRTYRNYYNGIRDMREFSHIVSNAGIGNPIDMGFTNIIKPRIDSILSQLEDETFNYQVNVVDEMSVHRMESEREEKRIAEINKAVNEYVGVVEKISEELYDTLHPDKELIEKVDEINKKYKTSYVSDLVKSAQNVLKYFEQDKKADIRQKLKLLLLDLLITGEAYYRVYIDKLGDLPTVEVIKPENLFHNKNTNSQYVSQAQAVVHREFMDRKTILEKYGKYMTSAQKRELFGTKVMARAAGLMVYSGSDMDYAGNSEMYRNNMDHFYSSQEVVEVMHVEWMAYNEVDVADNVKFEEETVTGKVSTEVNKIYRKDRYEITRIGGYIYVNGGKSQYIARSVARPYDCSLTYDGITYLDRNGRPYSMVGALKDLQDDYDVMIYYRDNLIANSGVAGDRVNVAAIPKILGKDFTTRMKKYLAYKRQGMELINPTEPGAALFQHYGSFDNTVKGNSIQAIDLVLQTIEKQADIIAGTNPQMLGQIEERDAVTNVKVGIHQSLMRNRSMFELFKSAHSRLLNDVIRAAQFTMADGFKASYVVGPTNYVFSIDPENFSYTDYGITVSYSSTNDAKLERLKQVTMEFAKGNVVPPSSIAKAMVSDSITEAVVTIQEGYEEVKREGDQLKQAMQQLEQLNSRLNETEKMLQQSQAEIDRLQKAADELRKREISIKEYQVEENSRLKEDELRITDEHYKRQDKLKEEIAQLQREQLYYTTGPAQEVKNDL